MIDVKLLVVVLVIMALAGTIGALREADAQELSIGPAVLDGEGDRLALMGDWRGEQWGGHVGGIDGETAYAGGSRLIRLGEVDFALGGVLVSNTNERISRGANFYFGLYYDWGPVVLSARHISNGAQTFGHSRKPNSGENILAVGWRF